MAQGDENDTEDIPKIEVYLPESNLQAEDIPFYAVWNAKKKFSVQIEVPEGLTLKELYNAAPEAVKKLDDKSFLVKETKINGYLSGIIISKVDADCAELIKSIKISLIQNEESSEKNKEIVGLFQPQIQLFRPDVKVVSEVPKKIIARKNANNDVKIDHRIMLSNYGKGMGIILIDVLNATELEMTYSEGIGKFIGSVIKDFESNLSELGKKYTQYNEMINRLILFLERPPDLSKTELEGLQNLV